MLPLYFSAGLKPLKPGLSGDAFRNGSLTARHNIILGLCRVDICLVEHTTEFWHYAFWKLRSPTSAEHRYCTWL